MGKSKTYILNRKTYVAIRKMDHCQMSVYLEGLYKDGYRDGKKSVEGLTPPEIRDILIGIKGLGEKRVNTIIEALETAMNEKANKI